MKGGKMKKKTTLNYIGIVTIILYSMIFSVVGMGLSDVINKINNTTLYGVWASYYISILLFYLMVYNIPLTK